MAQRRTPPTPRPLLPAPCAWLPCAPARAWRCRHGSDCSDRIPLLSCRRRPRGEPAGSPGTALPHSCRFGLSGDMEIREVKFRIPDPRDSVREHLSGEDALPVGIGHATPLASACQLLGYCRTVKSRRSDAVLPVVTEAVHPELGAGNPPRLKQPGEPVGEPI